MRSVILIIILGSYISCFSQDTTNLVPNWSFEVKDSCPNTYLFLNHVSFWNNGNTSTPDYFSSCNDTISDVPNNWRGVQDAKNGESYVGIFTKINGDEREYITIELINKLVMNRKYCFELFYSLAEISVYHSKSIQAYFSTDSVFQNDIYRINVSPQLTNTNTVSNDTLVWQKMEGDFIAQGEESYVTIGNFLTESLSNFQLTGFGTVGGAYYYIDAVRLYDCTQPDTTVYEISVFPNPNNGSFTLNYNLGENINTGIFRVYDAIGKLVYDEKLTQNNGRLDLNLFLSNGVYFWEITEDTGVILKSSKMVIVD